MAYQEDPGGIFNYWRVGPHRSEKSPVPLGLYWSKDTKPASGLDRWTSHLTHHPAGNTAQSSYRSPVGLFLAQEEQHIPLRRTLSMSVSPMALLQPAPSQRACCKCKKKVRFADSMGLSLTSVKLFTSSEEEPCISPTLFSGLKRLTLPDRTLDDLLISNMWDSSTSFRGKLSGIGSARTSSPIFLTPEYFPALTAEARNEEDLVERMRRDLLY
uniref:Protein phosphatase 1 regulatory subunit 3G n=1 Tax=Geotrypetes seraphini TaxID=260995 RepID=A0A6P8Q5W6_GEOSA|nr:protein phosphatase 1 regulatory subunit 3G [Geotrypetes seraphini]XP_033790670.1 protein phosphatase 1 regulatory subunit 3G [Geotrypetes seraphini]XP_033790671.1 protein phosphatase 1 regulatory subunit 3G [Geotrypetes seraphini]